MISSISKTSRRAAWILALAVAAAFVASASAAAQPADAEAVAGAKAQMAVTIDEVVAILEDESRPTPAKRRALEEIAHARFDFRTMSRLVLRQHWRGLDDAGQGDFVKEFTDYLANDYGRRLERYENETVEVLGAKPTGSRGDVVVETVIRGGANEGAVVDYRMKRTDEGWRIINVVVEGISLVHNFADQFREVINRDGAEGLLAQLREKNAAAQAETATGG